jgi:hypothetical protein
MPSRIHVEIADRVAALVGVLEAESERDPGTFDGSAEKRFLFALKSARANYFDARCATVGWTTTSS